MNRGEASPSPARFPLFSSASPSGSNNTATGRPPLWNSSSQRKVSRLYLYTTLPLQKIIDVVHAKSPDQTPGKDSANKKLNTLLDKEPRWLHPRTDSDMGRRLEELSRSTIRTSPRPDGYPDPPAPMLNPNSPFKREAGHSPAMLEVPAFAPFGAHSPENLSSQAIIPNHSAPRAVSTMAPTMPPPADQQDTPLGRFLRRSTVLSSSTDRTTGTLHRILQGYPDQYVRTVRRLVKRYTASNCQGMDAISPISEDAMPNTSWISHEDCPPCLPNRPYHLPGDFLSLDLLLQLQPPCFPNAEHHRNRSCVCFAADDIITSPWVTAKGGLSYDAQHILNHGMTNDAHLGLRDEFENTLLHFMAARAPMALLLQAVASNRCDPILHARNTAGQTFMHVLDPFSLKDHQSIYELLQILRFKGFDMFACDVYGRNFFHMMLLSEDVLARSILGHFDSTKYMRRDAFNVTPSPRTEPGMGIHRADTQAMDLDPPQDSSRSPSRFGSQADAAIACEARLIETVILAQTDPTIEDSEGRNGFHCLAAATLSHSSLLKKYGLVNPQLEPPPKGKKMQEPKDLDSCTERLNLRFSALNRLILAGVDPNHYDCAGYTPLMAFAAQLPEDDDYKFGPKIIESLILNGANVNARNRRGETALHIAVRCGRKLAARALVQNGANVHVRDSAGRSVLEVADVKTRNANCSVPKEYVHYEACRAWLSGKGFAVQSPTVLQEWRGPHRELGR